jgi:hypothetical protein
MEQYAVLLRYKAATNELNKLLEDIEGLQKRRRQAILDMLGVLTIRGAAEVTGLSRTRIQQIAGPGARKQVRKTRAEREAAKSALSSYKR